MFGLRKERTLIDRTGCVNTDSKYKSEVHCSQVSHLVLPLGGGVGESFTTLLSGQITLGSKKTWSEVRIWKMSSDLRARGSFTSPEMIIYFGFEKKKNKGKNKITNIKHVTNINQF